MRVVAAPSGVRVARQTSSPSRRSHGPAPSGARVSVRSRGRISSKVAEASATPRDYWSSVVDRHAECECASAANFGIHGQVAPMHTGNFSREPQPQSGAFHMLGALDPDKTGEKVGLVFS